MKEMLIQSFLTSFVKDRGESLQSYSKSGDIVGEPFHCGRDVTMARSDLEYAMLSM